MNDLISVIVPVYKVEEYLERCIESLLTQTYSNLEIILINDGSPDTCPKICDDYAIKDNRVIVIHQENGGLSSARNAGLNIFKGEYIMFVDSDDFISENIVCELLQDITENDADMSMCSFLKFNDQEEISMACKTKKLSILNNLEATSLLLLADHEICVSWGKLYKSYLFENLEYDVGKFAEDMFLIYKVFHKAKKIVLDERQFYYYSQEGLSLTRSEFNYKKLDMVDAALEWHHFVKLHYPELIEKSKIKYLTIMVNTCTLLSTKTDSYGKNIYLKYTNEIIQNYFVYINSNFSRINDKIKATLIVLRIYKYVVILKNKYS